MSKFERVLSVDWLPLEFKSGNEIEVASVMLSKASLESIINQTEQAVLAKLAEQEPVAWRITAKRFCGDTTKHKDAAEFWEKAEPGCVIPLYSCPMPVEAQEPVVYLYAGDLYSADGGDINDHIREHGTPLYSHPMPVEAQEPVAVVGPDFQLLYLGGKPISEIKGLKVGMVLYAHPMPNHARIKEALLFAAQVIELYDDASLVSDNYMLTSTDCAEIIKELVDYMPCVSPTIDKAACVSESTESDSEDAELLKKALENLIRAAHPSYMTCRWRQENLIRARDIAFKALKTHRLNAKEHHRTAKNYIPDAGKMVVPEGWQLVPVEPTLDMIKALRHRAAITSNGNIVNPSNMIKAALAAAPKLGGGDDC